MKRKIWNIVLFAIILLPLKVNAAGSANISVNSTVEVGSKVTATVTLKNTAAWNIKITSSGSTSGCSQSFADATSTGQNATKTLSVTCKATSVGAIGFTVTGDITSADGTNTNVSLSKRVTVTEPREKSSDATLSSLSVADFELTPSFNKDVLEYSTNVPSTINTITIAAKVSESHAHVEGIGEFEVTEGINTFNVVVTAEKGNTITYIINVNVEDLNPIEIQIGTKKYTIIKNAKNLIKPENYEEKTIKIQDYDIPTFYSEISGFTLVGVKDADGKISLAIYNEKENTYQLYNEFTSSNLVLYLTSFPNPLDGYIKDTITINNTEVEVYRYKENSRFVICYAMNVQTGKYDYYSYDTEENTFQIYNEEEIKELNKEVKTYLYVTTAFGVGLLVAIILIICLLSSKRKKAKKKNKKELEQKENVEPKEKMIETDEDMQDLLKEMKKKKRNESKK